MSTCMDKASLFAIECHFHKAPRILQLRILQDLLRSIFVEYRPAYARRMGLSAVISVILD